MLWPPLKAQLTAPWLLTYTCQICQPKESRKPGTRMAHSLNVDPETLKPLHLSPFYSPISRVPRVFWSRSWTIGSRPCSQDGVISLLLRPPSLHPSAWVSLNIFLSSAAGDSWNSDVDVLPWTLKPVSTTQPPHSVLIDSLSHPGLWCSYIHPCPNALIPWPIRLSTSTALSPHTRVPVLVFPFHLLDRVINWVNISDKLVHLPLRWKLRLLIESIIHDSEHLPDWSNRTNLDKENRTHEETVVERFSPLLRKCQRDPCFLYKFHRPLIEINNMCNYI